MVEYGEENISKILVVGSNPTVGSIKIYAVVPKPGLRERSAKLLFVGSNPTHGSNN